jgi:uncharacterized protein YkwD
MFHQNIFLLFENFPLNWLDILVLLVVFFYAIEGYSIGFYYAILDFISFVMAFVFGLSFYSFLANGIVRIVAIPQGFAKALGFFIIAFLTEVILSFLLRNFIERTSLFKSLSKSAIHKKVSNVLGIFPAILSALVLIAFILTMIMTLPVSAYLKKAVSSSIIGNQLVANTQGLGKDINNVFGGAVNEGIAFFTVEPKSNESVNLNFKTDKISIDEVAEKEMFLMVNSEREKEGVVQLKVDQALTKVAREHCQDMFKRGYFSHNTPEGYTPFDRMAMHDISYAAAGENLALAPNMTLAMDGLMKSPGHRENILSSDFGKIGIGVIDGGIYGEMFCQEFTD